MEEEISTNLTINDLKTIISVLDACAARGAFKINEFGPVSELYNKIVSCVVQTKQETT